MIIVSVYLLLIFCYSCTNLLSNSIAIRLLLKMAMAQKITVTTVNTVILLGDRVSTELLASLEKIMINAKRIAVGMLLTETGAVPILSDKTTNLIRSIGKPLQGYEVSLIFLFCTNNNFYQFRLM